MSHDDLTGFLERSIETEHRTLMSTSKSTRPLIEIDSCTGKRVTTTITGVTMNAIDLRGSFNPGEAASMTALVSRFYIISIPFTHHPIRAILTE